MYILSTLIFFKKIKISIGLKKDMGESVQKDRTLESSWMQIMTAETHKDYTNALIYVHVVLNGVIFPQISYDIVLYARHLLPVSFFSSD